MHTAFDHAVERWAALRTSANWEKAVAGQLAAAGVPVFLPTLSRVTAYPGKRARAEVPLFGGYVFCSEADFAGNPRVPPTCRGRVAQILRTADQATLRAELAAVAELLTDRQLVQERVFGRAGDAVRVTGRAFTGAEGVIAGYDAARGRLVLTLTLLGAAVEVGVDESMVRPRRG